MRQLWVWQPRVANCHIPWWRAAACCLRRLLRKSEIRLWTFWPMQSTGERPMIERIQWLGHASFRIQGLPLIYIDPWRIPRNAFHADVVLISHDHYDHCSLPDVEKLRGPDTVVLANSMAAALLPGAT